MTQASFVGAKNRFYLMLYDVINYNDVIFAVDSYESVKDYVSLMYSLWIILLSNMLRLEPFLDDPRMFHFVSFNFSQIAF